MTNEELIDYINSKIKKNSKKAITGDILNAALIAVIGLIVDAGGVVNWGTIEGTLSDQTDLLAALDAKLNKDGSNADVDVDLGAFAIHAKAAKINGTGGNGKLGLKHQSAAATATGSESVLYADSSGLPKWKNDGNTVEQLAYKSYVDSAVAGLLDLRGSHDSSGNTWPIIGGSGTAGAILKGDFWYVSVAGTLGGVSVNIGDAFFAK